MSRKLDEREARRRYILEAARELFAERGIDEPSMDELAAAAEYTRQTLYAYFRSKDEILLRVHCQSLGRRWELQRAALEGVEGAGQRLRVWAQALFAFWREHPHAMRMEMFWDYHGIAPERVGEEALAEFATLNEELAAALRSLFREGMASGELRGDLDPDMSVSQFVQCLRASAYRALSRTYSFAEFDAEAYLGHFLDLFAAGIRAESSTTKGGSA